MTVNTGMAILGALKVALGETLAKSGDLRHPGVEKYLQEILRVRMCNSSIACLKYADIFLGSNP